MRMATTGSAASPNRDASVANAHVTNPKTRDPEPSRPRVRTFEPGTMASPVVLSRPTAVTSNYLANISVALAKLNKELDETIC